MKIKIDLINIDGKIREYTVVNFYGSWGILSSASINKSRHVSYNINRFTAIPLIQEIKDFYKESLTRIFLDNNI